MTQATQVNEIDYNSPELRRSRKAYTAQCTFEWMVSLLVTDAFLAKLLIDIGMSDFLVGVISSFISLSFVFQLLSVFLVKLKASTKKIVIISDTASQLFFTLIYIVPFLPVSPNVKKALVMIFVFIAYVGKYMIWSMCYKWANSYVHPKKRALYSANKEIISLITGIIFVTVMGAVVDKFESLGNIHGGFIFISVSMMILNICNFISFMMIKKDDAKERNAERVPLRSVIKYTLCNKEYRNVIIMTCMWEFAKYFSVGFMGVYKMKELMLSVFSVQLINMAANICRMLVSRGFGRFSDKHSYAKGMELGLCVAALAYLASMCSTPEHWFFIVIYSVLYNCARAGHEQNSFNIAFSYVPMEYVSQAMAIKSSIGGICGFCSALVAGKLLDFIQLNGNTFFGINVYGQQILSGISFVLTVITILYIHFVIAKKVKVQ